MANVRHAVILADGAAPTRQDLDAAWPGWDERVALVIAADGGARHAPALGFRVDRWVGDGDSIDPAELEALAVAGVAIDRVPADKDESDTELALRRALDEGALTITILGALGGLRIDHALANLGLLEDPALDAREVRLYDEQGARISRLAAARGAFQTSMGFNGRVGDFVTLLPLGGPAEGVATIGLRYPLAGETLAPGRSRGLSNVRTAPFAQVWITSGRLLVIETPARFRR